MSTDEAPALRFRLGFDAAGRALPWLNELREQCGVYVLRSKGTGRVLYVGESHSRALAKTLKRHFYVWNDRTKRAHFTYDKHTTEIAIKGAPKCDTLALQRDLIAAFDPKDNTLEFPDEERAEARSRLAQKRKKAKPKTRTRHRKQRSVLDALEVIPF